MTHEEQRQQVIAACIAVQQHIADVAKQEMDSCQQQSNEYGANVDRYDSYRTKIMRQRDMYAKQYSNALSALRVLGDLQKIPPLTAAEHGAIVITNRNRFFLSIGAGKFDVNGEQYFAISAQTPAFLAMKGKHAGESFCINGVSQTILEVF